MIRNFITYCLILFMLANRCSAEDPESKELPNFIVIVTDDQRHSTVQKFMPATWGEIFSKGARFSNAYIPTPICGPSRAAILTGNYACNNGVRKNNQKLNPGQKLISSSLKKAGYTTGLVGKFLNGYEGRKHKSFDYWVSFEGGNVSYYNPVLNVQKEVIQKTGYVTNILGGYAEDFVKQNKNNPFFLYLAFNAPHYPHIPARRTKNKLQGYKFDFPESFLEADVSDKPAWIQRKAGPDVGYQKIQKRWNRRIKNQHRTLITLDKSIKRLIRTVRKAGVLDNTVIIFISDNGILWGEHRFFSKATAYEEATRVPMAIRYPRLIVPETVSDKFVANVDISATIAGLAGVDHKTDGVSLIDVLNNKNTRESLLLRGYSTGGGSSKGSYHPFRALRNANFVYVETKGDLPELYDLTADPLQLNNIVTDEGYSDIKTDLKGKMTEQIRQICPTEDPLVF